MKIIKNRKFILWASTSIFLGLLPWFVNFLVQFISNHLTYYTVFQVNDLMFFVITLNATSMLNLLLWQHSMDQGFLILSLISMFILAIVAALFLGIASFFTTIPPASGLFSPVQFRLIACCLVLCIFAILLTFSVHIHLIKQSEEL